MEPIITPKVIHINAKPGMAFLVTNPVSFYIKLKPLIIFQ